MYGRAAQARPSEPAAGSAVRAIAAISLIGFGLLLGFAPARAESRLYVGAPVAFDFSGGVNGAADSTSGYTAGWGFPFHLGLGLTRIGAEGVDDAKLVTVKATYSLVDLFAWFRAWGTDLQIGYGRGNAELEPFQDASGVRFEADKADASQWFITAGLPLGRRFSIHLGYHSVSAESANIRANGVDAGPFVLDGAAWSLGFQIAMN
jgi:hypothetical protein